VEIIKLHPDLITPTRGTEGAAGYDLYMPKPGTSVSGNAELHGLGFAAKVPAGHAALILPRSGAGVKSGIRLGNTCGVIDSDYEGEWKVNIQGRAGDCVQWAAGERLFQFVVVPVVTPELQFVSEFSESSNRGAGGFGSTGK
jgi:dUTP pyrophosphatase